MTIQDRRRDRRAGRRWAPGAGLAVLLLLAAGLACGAAAPQPAGERARGGHGAAGAVPPAGTPDYGLALAEAARQETLRAVAYDPAYFRIPYPGGDVPPDRGVCTDLVVRAFRRLGLDLQKTVHEDMAAHFGLYPRRWGLSAPDPNIDHRRVPNLAVYFARFGRKLPVSRAPVDYRPGDVVTWDLAGLPHIGIVAAACAPDGVTPMVAHNVGAGQVLEDFLFQWPITAHFRFEKAPAPPR